MSQTKRFIAVGFFLAVVLAAAMTSRGTATFAASGGLRPTAASAQDEGGQAAGDQKAAAPEKMEKKGGFDAGQKQADADAKSAGCITCHAFDKEQEPLSMHPFGPDNIGCADCHGGNYEVTRPEGTDRGDKAFEQAKKSAHVQPKYPEFWERKGKQTAANPIRLTANMLKESLDYIQFVNPGDLRIVDRTCGTSGCHEKEAGNVNTSMMKHGALLWEAALYNNGALTFKNGRFGESYSKEGQPERLYPLTPISDDEAWTS